MYDLLLEDMDLLDNIEAIQLELFFDKERSNYNKIIKEYRNDFTTNHYDINKFMGKYYDKIVKLIESEFKSLKGCKVEPSKINKNGKFTVNIVVDYSEGNKLVQKMSKFSFGTVVKSDKDDLYCSLDNNIFYVDRGTNSADDISAKEYWLSCQIEPFFTTEDSKLNNVSSSDVAVVLKYAGHTNTYSYKVTKGFVYVIIENKDDYDSISSKLKGPNMVKGKSVYLINPKMK